jgi:hypothetical protein
MAGAARVVHTHASPAALHEPRAIIDRERLRSPRAGALLVPASARSVRRRYRCGDGPARAPVPRQSTNEAGCTQTPRNVNRRRMSRDAFIDHIVLGRWGALDVSCRQRSSTPLQSCPAGRLLHVWIETKSPYISTSAVICRRSGTRAAPSGKARAVRCFRRGLTRAGMRARSPIARRQLQHGLDHKSDLVSTTPPPSRK